MVQDVKELPHCEHNALALTRKSSVLHFCLLAHFKWFYLVKASEWTSVNFLF